MRRVLALFAAASVAAPLAAQPLTTGFTYQGELRQSGALINSKVDLQFKLFDALSAGSQIGSTLCVNDIIPTEGRFTTSLDFGNAFNGQRRYLEVYVRADSAGATACAVATGYTVLTPRQELTITPNAAFALSAATATTATTATTAGTATTATNSTQLNSQNAAFYQNVTNLNAGTLADVRLSSNVALLGNSQTFTATKSFSVAPAFTAAGAPFTVATTNRVTNLNADLFDGLDSSTFFRTGNPIDLATASPGASTVRANNLDVSSFDSSSIRGNIYGTTGVNAIGVIGYKGPSGASHTMIGGGAGVVGYADSGLGIAGVLFGTGTGTAIYGFAETPNASAGLFQGRVAVNGTFDVNLPTKSVQFRLDGGLVPGINLSGTGGSLGILRLRNSLEVWPNDAATAPGRLDVRDTSGAARVILDGSDGRIIASGSLDVDEWGQNNGTFGPGVLRLGGGGSGEGLASNRTSDANGNRYGIDFYTGGGAKRMSITVDGKVGVGTSSPIGLFQVGDGSDAAVSIPPGAAMNSVPYTSPNAPDVPKQTFVAPDSIAIASIELHISNAAAAARSTAITISGPGVNTLSNTVSLPPTGGSPVTLIFSSFVTTPVLTAGGTYTINFVGGPIDGLVRTYFRTDDPYAGGAASGLGIPAGADLVCTIRLFGASSAPGLTVTSDGRVGIRTTAPSAPLTVGGDAIVTGTLSKGGGSFRIDHPLDPANKFLFHSFVESPDMMNIYNGNIRTDSAGYATITLPEWFSALNRDFRYQLTVIDEAAPDAHFARIARKIGPDNTFLIKTIPGHLEVSWQVTGIRHDAFANANRIPIEADKPAASKGLYLHPEAHGLPASRGIYSR